jgi:anti-sigma factor ChrR (cupin superfamily)
MVHPGLKRLIAYREGTLPAAEREVLQEHLSLCRRCTGLLRELKAFEAAAVGGEAAGPESLREEAWAALAPMVQAPVSPPVGGRPEAQPWRAMPPAVYAVAAVLLLAVLGLALWTVSTLQQERRRLARVERQLEERERELAMARAQSPEIDELEKRVAELTAALEALRPTAKTPENQDRIAAASLIAASVAPRFALRGQESPEEGFLRGDGAVNPVPLKASGDRFTVALSLAGHPLYGEYRCELLDRSGAVLWSVRRPGSTLLGDAGTAVSVKGLGPGLYRLRIAGLQAKRWAPLGEYLLDVRLLS